MNKGKDTQTVATSTNAIQQDWNDREFVEVRKESQFLLCGFLYLKTLSIGTSNEHSQDSCILKRI
jgi:hypothetical protein